MAYSVQQIKFELLAYIKEFGGGAEQWHAGTADDAAAELFGTLKVDPSADIWLWKPALSASAAALVLRWMVDRGKVTEVESERPGRCVFLFQRAT